MSRGARNTITAAVALALIAVPFVAPDDGDGDPSPAELAAAIRETGACEAPAVREVDNLGGPGLPEDMRAAREIACGQERLALHYVFDDDDSARGWLRDNGYVESPGSWRWRMRDGTLVGAVLLNAEQWEAALERVGLAASG